MKNLFINLLFCCIFATSLHASAVPIPNAISQNDALTIAQKQFVGQDVDYYILTDKSEGLWTIFVDAEPMKGWQHNCYILTIPKFTRVNKESVTPQKKLRSMPPSEDYAPLLVKNRYGDNASSKPKVKKQTSSNSFNNVAQRTYAIILSGGINKNANYERYWNDCSFIYQTLVNKYNIPKENIYPIMADGNDPSADMKCISGEYMSQPLDLDDDGTDDIKLAATKENVKNTLETLNGKINKDDHLFIFVIDHGGTADNNKSSYICLWNNEKLYDYELANMLDPFTSKFVNVNVVLGQCFSGGFNDDLTKVGCVVASASKGNEPSWACTDIPYDEFVYQWTCAVNQATHTNKLVFSDKDFNLRVTMEEAFNYAKTHDRVSQEHPVYTSTPTSVGEDLAFNHLVPSVDLYIKDNEEDTGKEPNNTTDTFWKSPSIRIRNNPDFGEEHQNPMFSPDHQIAYVYVRVYNRGKEAFYGTGKWLLVYWAQASTGITTKTWKGRELYNDAYATGGCLEANKIDTIEPGQYKDIPFRWALPNLLEKYQDGNFHFCLLAKIMDKPYDDGYVDGHAYFNVKGKKSQAQKNVTIISKKDVGKAFNVYIRNTSSTSKAYTLELIPQTAADTTLYSNAKIELWMSPKIYNAWERGGLKSVNTEMKSNTKNPYIVKFMSPKSKVENVLLDGDEFDVVQLKFDFNKFASQSNIYTLDLVQKDENGNIVGGETFVVESPAISWKPIGPVDIVPINGGNIILKVNKSDFNSVKWIDEKGETLGNNESINVKPMINGTKYTVIAMTEDGEASTQSVSLENKYGIESAYIIDKKILVTLKDAAPINASIIVSPVTDNMTKTSCNVPEGTNSATIDATTLRHGVYVISYVVGTDIIDQIKIRIE